MSPHFFLPLALCCLFTFGHAMAQPPIIKIGTTAPPPLSLPDQSGMLDRMLKEAFARIGAQVEFITLPSERSLVDADRGIIDGESNRIAGLQYRYPHLVQVPESNMTYEFMAFTTKPGLAIKDWNDLAPLSVAYIIGWKILEDNVRAAKVTKRARPKQLFLFLQSGRADVVLLERLGGNYYLKELGISDGYAIEPPLARREMYLYLNAKHADLVAPLAKALRDMKADGSYARFFRAPEANK